MVTIFRVLKLLLMSCLVATVLLIIGGAVLFYKRIHDVQVLSNLGEAGSAFRQAYELGPANNDWMLTDNQINVIVDELNMMLRSENTLIPSYKLQLLGHEKDGRKLVYFNGFCFTLYSEVSEYWRTTPVLINDGGKCVFDGSFDLENGDIESFRFGG